MGNSVRSFLTMLGVVIGARLIYVLFYNPAFYIQNPLEIIVLWHGGLSFHGGLIGAIIGGLFFCKKKNMSFYDIADICVIPLAFGLFLGRIGNFLNSELVGRITDVPWCVKFKDYEGCRHPSQLYEAFFEGLLLFAVLWYLRTRSKFEGFLFSVYLIGYGVVRFFIEYFREPDAHLGFIVGSFSMGQLLCLVMIAAGIIVLSLKNKKSVNCK